MKAVAVLPRQPASVHLADLARPSLSDVPGGRGVLIRVLRCGVDGADKEINAGDYGAPPAGSSFLVLGHENFGQVEAVGENVSEARAGGYDLIFEATGFSPVVFDSMQALARNGVLVLSSVTGGNREITVPADRINLDFVLGNKVMVGTVNANREYFESGVKDMAQAESEYPGWLGRLLTHPVKGLENYRQLFESLNGANGAIKVYCEIAE
jgi:threonine dehydrogenase-like Zn-dependent dehydrogenase